MMTGSKPVIYGQSFTPDEVKNIITALENMGFKTHQYRESYDRTNVKKMLNESLQKIQQFFKSIVREYSDWKGEQTKQKQFIDFTKLAAWVQTLKAKHIEFINILSIIQLEDITKISAKQITTHVWGATVLSNNEKILLKTLIQKMLTLSIQSPKQPQQLARPYQHKDRELEHQKAENQRLGQMLEDSKRKFEQLERKIQSAPRVPEYGYKELEHQKAENQRLRQMRDDFKRKSDQLEWRLQSAQQMLEQQQKKSIRLRQENDNLRSQKKINLVKSEKQLEHPRDIQPSSHNYVNENQQLKEENKRLTKQNAVLMLKLQSFQTNENENPSVLKALKRNQTTLNSTIESLRNTNKLLIAKYEKMEKNYHELLNQAREAKLATQQLKLKQQTIDELNKNNDILRQWKQRLEKECQSRQSQIDRLMSQANSKKQENPLGNISAKQNHLKRRQW